MQGGIVNGGIAENLNQVLLVRDEDKRLSMASVIISQLEEKSELKKYDLLNLLELHRNFAVSDNNPIKETVIYLLMLKLSSHTNMGEIEEKLHVNFPFVEALKYDNLLKKISNINDAHFQQILKQILEEVEHSTVRIVAQQSENVMQAAKIPEAPEKTEVQDPELLDKISKYKRIILGEAKTEAEIKRGKPVQALSEKIKDFTRLEQAEQLWQIAAEILRRLGLSPNKIVLILPVEKKMLDPQKLLGTFTDNYIALQSGLWQLSQQVLSQISVENADKIEQVFVDTLDSLMGQMQVCLANKTVLGVAERKYDVMPFYHNGDEVALNQINLSFNEMLSRAGNSDEWFDLIVLALKTLSQRHKEKAVVQNLILKFIPALWSAPSKATVTPRTAVPVDKNEFNYFV